MDAASLAHGIEREFRLGRPIPDHEHVGACRGERAAAVPHAQRSGLGRQRQTEPALRMDHVRELAFDTVGDERMHVAGGVQPAVRELWVADASVPHELAEMRFDAGRPA